MATIASLLIELGANVARLQKDMDQAGRVVAGWERSTKRAVGTVQTAFAGLGVAIGAGAFVAGIKSAIDQADELNKLSQKVGIATEALSELAYAADLSDISREGLTKGLKTLSTNMFEAAQGSKEALASFKGLGVEFQSAPGKLRATDEVLIDLADRFSKMPDGAAKAALAVKMFGKEGLNMIPFLNQGRAGIQQLREEAQRLGIVMSSDMAASAERFNDNMRAVKASADGMKISMANSMMPGLTNIAKAMKLAAEEGGFLTAVLVGIGGVMSELFTKSDEAQLRGVQKRLEDLRTEWTNIRNSPPGFRGGMDKRLDRVQRDMNEALKEEEVIKARIAARDKDLRDGRPKPNGDVVDPRKFGGDDGKGDKSKNDSWLASQYKRMADEEAKNVREAMDANNQASDVLEERARMEQKWGQAFENMTLEEIKEWEKRKFAALDYLRAQEEVRMRLLAGFDENGDKIVDDAKKAKEAAKDIGLIFQSAASNAIRDWQGVGNLIRSIGQDIAQMIMKKAVIDPIGNAIGGMLGGLDFGGMLSFAGGGSTGSGPRTGGLDGQGGFMAMVHPNETVVDHARGQSSGGATIVQNIHFSANTPAAVRDAVFALAPQLTKASIAAVRDERNRTGDRR